MLYMPCFLDVTLVTESSHFQRSLLKYMKKLCDAVLKCFTVLDVKAQLWLNLHVFYERIGRKSYFSEEH